jgi:N-acetylmuramoyl-L-alanine amidase
MRYDRPPASIPHSPFRIRHLLLILLILSKNESSAGPAGVLRFDGKEYPLETIYQSGGVTYLPVEATLRQLGANVVWRADAKRLTIRWDDRLAALDPFSANALVNGQWLTLKAAPRFFAGRFFAPVDFFERAVPALAGKPVELANLQPTAPPPVAPRLFVDSSSDRHHMLAVHKLALDAGHGGHDLGARSPQGYFEKDINLALALKLADRLRRETDLDVILTRSDDTFVPLPERTRIANLNGAEMFLCIHANGAYRRTATGFEVYFLSLKSSDDRAARLAATENGGESATVAPNEPPASGDDVNQILRDMIRTENLAASERLAIAMQARLDLAMNIENRGVKQAPFFVLAGAQMPAVLIEVGFMSNPEEAELLRTPATQARIVDALFNAVLYYDAVTAAP